MKKLFFLAAFALTALLSAEDITYTIVESEPADNHAAVGAGMEMEMVMGEYSDPDPYGDYDTYMDMYFSVPIYFQADLKFSDFLSYIGQFRIDAIYMAMSDDIYADDEMLVFRNLSIDNYLLLHISDKTETKNQQVTVSSTFVGSDYYYNYYSVKYITVPLPSREIVSVRLGKPLYYTVGAPFSISPLYKLSVGAEYAYYQNAVIETDQYGTVRINDIMRFYADLYVASANVDAGVFDNLGLYLGTQIAFDGFDMQTNIAIAGRKIGGAAAYSGVVFYYDFLFGFPFTL